LNLEGILKQLKVERDRLTQAINLLEGSGRRRPGRPTGASLSTGATKRKRRRGITREGRKRLSEMMKKRWAERRKKASRR
jgi:membrane-bound lytic murein transglycosylase B